MIEKNFDVPFTTELALKEKQIQQNYRPIIAVHKWFARRPGTLFRSLLLAEFGKSSVQDLYFKSNNLKGIKIADPFMGGGTPLIEANRLGCDIVGYDINPMAYWIVREEIKDIDLSKYQTIADDLIEWLGKNIGEFYQTKCVYCSSDVKVKYFLWVKMLACQQCGKNIDLFPGHLVAQNRRHPRNVIICHKCGELNEVVDINNLDKCQFCNSKLLKEGPAKKGICICPYCNFENHYPNPEFGSPRHRMFAIEYHCPKCKQNHKGRFFKKPDKNDLLKYDKAAEILNDIIPNFVPDDEIPKGDETNRLHRWGYRHYNEMFNERQLLGLELSAQFISGQQDKRIRNSLATNFSDILRYQNMLCRYDTMALKSLDIFSIHGFPVGLVQCESNLLGIIDDSKNTIVGSGGWLNIIKKYFNAKEYCLNPFEFKHKDGKKKKIFLPDEWIGEQKNGAKEAEKRNISLKCESGTAANLLPDSLDGVFTDPPYFQNIQYAELMDFCYIWLRRLINDDNVFKPLSTRNPIELTGNVTMGRSLSDFTKGISKIFIIMTSALKKGAPFVFTYHHNNIKAYFPIAVGILDSGFICTASIPCPAEMSASIHINGTGSSIIDTVFVCRSASITHCKDVSKNPEIIANYVIEDIEKIKEGNMKPKYGDIRCITYGHLIRIAISHLSQSWDLEKSIEEKLNDIKRMINIFGDLATIEKHIGNVSK